MNYKEAQKERQQNIMQDVIGGHSYPYFLADGRTNLYKPIRSDVLHYFENNNIGWWHGKYPTPNTLSSQISCLNHLFYISGMHDVVLKMVQGIDNSFIDVLPVPHDKPKKSVRYIAFEVVAQTNNFMNEGKPKRGATCTSLDALIIAQRQSGEKCLIPIEWKYTEQDKTDKSNNKTRHKRYDQLINNSHYLLSTNANDDKILFKEPYFQLMRQTLWADRVIHSESELWHNAMDFIHLHVVPKENLAMRGHNNDIEVTWKNCLRYKEKYILKDPSELFEPLKNIPTCKELIEYLSKRYW